MILRIKLDVHAILYRHLSFIGSHIMTHFKKFSTWSEILNCPGVKRGEQEVKSIKGRLKG